MPSTEQTLRLTVAALMRLTGEHQADLAAGLGLNQTQISRRQAGTATWTLANVDKLSAHYGIPVGDLLVGVDRAVHCPPAAALPPPEPPSSPSPRDTKGYPRRHSGRTLSPMNTTTAPTDRQEPDPGWGVTTS